MAIADHVQNCPQTSHPALSSTWTVYYRTGIGRLSVIVMEEHAHRGTPEQNFSEESLQFWGDTCKVCNHPVFHYQFNDENVRPNFGKLKMSSNLFTPNPKLCTTQTFLLHCHTCPVVQFKIIIYDTEQISNLIQTKTRSLPQIPVNCTKTEKYIKGRGFYQIINNLLVEKSLTKGDAQNCILRFCI